MPDTSMIWLVSGNFVMDREKTRLTYRELTEAILCALSDAL